MKQEFSKMDEEFFSCETIQNLPNELFGFVKKTIQKTHENIHELLEYRQEESNRSLLFYYDSETNEYNVQEKIGSLYFCRLECIADTLDEFCQRLKNHFKSILTELDETQPNPNLSCLLTDAKIFSWNYENDLPKNFENFELVIEPKRPLCFSNGSYILFSYENFQDKKNFSAFYNIFRDEFFAQSCLHGVFEIEYDFYAKSLEKFQTKLQKYLRQRLKNL